VSGPLIKYTDAEHIQEFIASGKVECLASDISEAAERHLELSFPFRKSSTIIDWDSLPSSKLHWNTVSDDETAVWAASTLAGQCSYALLLFSPTQPCLLGTFDFMIRNLDELVWKAPGNRILFGVNRNDFGEVKFSNGIIEFNGKGELFASIGQENEN